MSETEGNVGYKIIIIKKQSFKRKLLTMVIYHLISTARSWNNCYIVFFVEVYVSCTLQLLTFFRLSLKQKHY